MEWSGVECISRQTSIWKIESAGGWQGITMSREDQGEWYGAIMGLMNILTDFSH